MREMEGDGGRCKNLFVTVGHVWYSSEWELTVIQVDLILICIWYDETCFCFRLFYLADTCPISPTVTFQAPRTICIGWDDWLFPTRSTPFKFKFSPSSSAFDAVSLLSSNRASLYSIRWASWTGARTCSEPTLTHRPPPSPSVFDTMGFFFLRPSSLSSGKGIIARLWGGCWKRKRTSPFRGIPTGRCDTVTLAPAARTHSYSHSSERNL